jgi:GntR family transcriptional repressor for pyruvate dehydrogenase complex
LDEERRAFEIVPIRRVDVYGSVLAQLSAMIREMSPGDRLPPERELVERLGVSRVSVREALRALESMGKIEIRPQAGSFVVHPDGNAFASQLKALLPVDRAFLRHLVDVRAAVEDRVVALVAGRAEADLSKVREVIERSAADLGESGEPGSMDLRFEAALARACGNPLLAEMQRSVHQLWVEAWSACGISPGDWRRFLDEHRAILGALEGGEGELARRLMAEHVDRAVEET